MAGDWQFSFFGINPEDFKGRKWLPAIAGAATSFIVHEAGHLAAGHIFADGAHWDPNYGNQFGGAIICHGYNKMSHTQQQLFHAGGFILQAIVGGTLTAIPYTRHSDFALGFNTTAMTVNLLYLTKNNVNKWPTSDVARIDNGEAAAIASGLLHGSFAYINLNKARR